MDTQQIDEKAIFNAARQIADAAAREDFLTKACGSDEPAIDRVRELLRVHAHAQSFLESPAADLSLTIDSTPIAERPGTIIGPYKLLQMIGEGGMGVVFMAEQTEPIQRTVALKIIKPGMDTRQVIARFEAERQALAMMDHPNIAHVLDAGATETGRPYFVMDLVKGVQITEYCDRQHYSVRQRLELVTVVCQAVQHAHQKGLIHRDIKPSNVLVAEYDGKPVPKIIDFGVAKAIAQKLTERTMFTEFGQIVGTFEYMSPEQARFNQLDVDTRSDIYSLGVLLYELLAGSTPLEKERLRAAAYDEILRIIGEEEPPRPSTRLSSSATLPSIAANRHTEPARLSKEVSGELDWIVMKCLEKDRNRRYETANALSIDLQHYLCDEEVTACPPSAVYRLRKFVRRNKVSVLTSAIVATSLVIGTAVSLWQATLARRAEALAEARLVAETEARERATTVTSMLHTLLEKVLSAQREKTGLQSLMAPVIVAYRKVIELRPRDTLAYINLGNALSDQGKFDDAVAALRKAIEIAPDDALAYDNLGDVLTSQRKLDEAVAMCRKAIELQPRDAHPYINLGTALYHQGKLDEAIATYRTAIEHKGDVADHALAYTDLGAVLGEQQKFEEAIAVHRKAIELKPDLAGAHLNLGNALEGQDKLDDAITAFRRSIELQPDYAEAYENLGLALMAQGKLDEAVSAYRRAIELEPNIAKPYGNLGIALGDQGKLDESIAAYRKVIELKPDDVNAYYNLGNTLQAQEKFDDAIAMFRKAIELKPDYAEAHTNLGINLNVQGKLDEAIAAYRKAIELKPDLINPHATLTIALNAQGKSDEAIAAFRKAIEVKPDLTAFSKLGMALAAQEKLDEVVAAFRKGIELQPTADNYNAVAWELAASPLSQQRHWAIAAEWAARAVELSPQDGNFWNTLGLARYRTGNWQDAVGALEKSMELRNGGDASDWLFLAMTNWRLGEKENARKWYDRAVEWMKKNQPNNAELLGIHVEAAQLLGITEPQPETNTAPPTNKTSLDPKP